MSEVAIIGSGPAGLMAALAVERNGHVPAIYSIKQKSEINEDMFVQQMLPELAGTGFKISYHHWGEEEVYALKVYGTKDAPTSWSKVPEQGWGWWLKPLYDQLWDRYEHIIDDIVVNPEFANDLTENYPLVISTIPQGWLCKGGHIFESRKVWLGRRRSNFKSVEEATMIYNGNEDDRWYRYSTLNGWTTWEYASMPPTSELDEGVKGLIPGEKVTSTNCDCNPKVHRVGRWAQWRHGVLNHHPFQQTTSLLATEAMGKEDR